jgi:hypothetical protein
MTPDQIREIARCANGKEGCIHFLRAHCKIEDPQVQEWLAFDLWPEQEEVVRMLFENQKLIALKARQLGLTWLAIGVALWEMLFLPGSSIGLFSARDQEAVVLLKDRLKGMYDRLPEWLRSPVGPVNNDHEWRLANGSIARAFPTGRGDSYTFSRVIVDEADLADNLDATLRAVKPTIDAGGKLFLLSKARKQKPKSLFKSIYRGARDKVNGWAAVFLPWWVRKSRTAEWYEQEKRETLENTGSLDDLYENYPATDDEALRPRELDKRFAHAWIDRCKGDKKPINDPAAPSINGLRIYSKPEPGRLYRAGCDTAEGNPQSDASSLTIVDRETFEEVAKYSGRVEPATLADYIAATCHYYNKAAVLVERNNHGHAVLLGLRGKGIKRLDDATDNKPGHYTSAKSKTLMMDDAADILRAGDAIIHSSDTREQLASLEGSTLKAPEGEHDDEAISWMLAMMAAKRPRSTAF